MTSHWRAATFHGLPVPCLRAHYLSRVITRFLSNFPKQARLALIGTAARQRADAHQHAHNVRDHATSAITRASLALDGASISQLARKHALKERAGRRVAAASAARGLLRNRAFSPTEHEMSAYFA